MAQSGDTVFRKNRTYRIYAAEAELNSSAVHIVSDERLSRKKGVALKAGIPEATLGERAQPDLIFRIKAPARDRYRIKTYAVTDEEGAALMRQASSKFESMYMRMQIDDQPPTRRVIYVPWDRPSQTTGKFVLTDKMQEIRIWLPRGVRLEYLELRTYQPPEIPEKARNYQPAILPPKSHPRLWVNADILPVIRKRLQHSSHRAVWERVRKIAKAPFEFSVGPREEISFNTDLETAAEMKAFYYLMTGDKAVGRAAIELMLPYLSHVEFGNLLDITREMGRAIYIGSEVYDWTYELLSEAEKTLMVHHLLRLADDMEIGWPPFRTGIVNGHGNEAQVNRDLLSMSIAIYNEDPLPYQYTSYAILETLVPMRKFEYQSPRHNQGVNYAAYRFAWEMHAAWLMYRMRGKPVFDDNIKNLSRYWMYMRTPGGDMLRDGDGFSAGKPGEPYYWKSPLLMFLMANYSGDPLVKHELIRQGGLETNPVLFLLLNDPELQGEANADSLPLSIDFGPVLGGMIARTGWDIGPESDEVLAEIKGGGYHFGNHQHADAGAIQVYYRGFLLGDIGLYRFYGTPYDMGFNKRSVAHSMMLAVDPDEKFYRSEVNDGGARFNQKAPASVEEVKTDPWFNNGKVISATYGPDPFHPEFTYFSADLSGAYSDKISAYTRSFTFLNLNDEGTPAAIILKDDMKTRDSSFRKYWQINTLNAPEDTGTGWIIRSIRGQDTGKAYVNMLLPSTEERHAEILSGKDTYNVFGVQLQPPGLDRAEARGHRLLVSPERLRKEDQFLTVMLITDGQTPPPDVRFSKTLTGYLIHIGKRVVHMSKNGKLIEGKFTIELQENGVHHVALTGLKKGFWEITGEQGQVVKTLEVEEGKNTGFFTAKAGSYTIRLLP